MSNQQYVEFNPQMAGIIADAEEKKGRALTTTELRNLVTPIIEKAFDWDEKHGRKYFAFQDQVRGEPISAGKLFSVE
jgi:hypothetical protein